MSNAVSLPELEHLSIDECALLATLGPVLEVYRPDQKVLGASRRGMYAGLGVAVLAWVAAVVVLFERNRSEQVLMSIVMALFGLIFAVMCGWQLLRQRRGGRVCVLICQEGLAKLEPEASTFVPWYTVEAVENSVSFNQSWLLHLHHGGRVLKFDSGREALVGMALLPGRILQYTAPWLMRRYLLAIEEGKPVVLGPLTVTRDGVEARGRRLSWDDMENVRIYGGLRFRKRGAGWFDYWRWSVFYPPNLPLCFALIQQLRARFRRPE
jgi:hypothetical protein